MNYGGVERLFPLREVLMGGIQGGIGFVNAPLTASEVQTVKKEITCLLEVPAGISNQVDQFLGPSISREFNSILGILFSSEDLQLIQTDGMQIWERENRPGPSGEQQIPFNLPDWNPNDELGWRNMKDYRTLIIRGIKEAVPRTRNVKLAFDCQQEKDETPSARLERLKRNFQLYSSIDTEDQKGKCWSKCNL